jgi:hypothetical protein
MQAKESKSNQAGSVDAAVSCALAVLSAYAGSSDLRRLAEKLARLRASDAQPRAIESRRRRPRRPGWVLDAVCRVLVDQASGPMRVKQVHAAVEALLGETVSESSVSWALASHSTGASPHFVRIARGRYVLANDV